MVPMVSPRLDPVNRAASANSRAPEGVGGWLLVLCILLLVWQPASFGLTAAGSLDVLELRGLSLALLLALRVLVTAFGIAAGLALMSRRAGAVTFAKASL